MNVTIQSEEDLEKKFIEGIHILNNLRHWTLKYNETLGSELKVIKKRWEEKADEYLKSLSMTPTRVKTEIKIIKNQ